MVSGVIDFKGRSINVRRKGEGTDALGQICRIVIFRQIELNEIFAGWKGFHNRRIILSGQREASCSGSLAPRFEQAMPSVVKLLGGAKKQALDGPSRLSLPKEASLEHGDVVSENAQPGRQKVRKFVKIMMVNRLLAPAVDKQAGAVATVAVVAAFITARRVTVTVVATR